MLDRPHDPAWGHPAHQTALDPRELGRVLCVAPHPDDEVLGAGGLLAQLAESGLEPRVWLLTSGEEGFTDRAVANPPVEDRLQESAAAAARLGYAPPIRVPGLRDGAVRYGPALINTLVRALAEHACQTVLLPALTEPHPDHQAVALAGMAAVVQALEAGQAVKRILFYEVGAPTVPNAWVDITAVAARKWAAIECFQSQLALQPYLEQAQALARVRAFGHPGCAAAEAFLLVDAATLRRQGPSAAAWFAPRRALALALQPADLPRVAVLIRSMDRDCLADALASVAAQTYPNVEVWVLNASGRRHRSLPLLDPALVCRLIEPGPTVNPEAFADGAPPLGRAEAANQLLDACDAPLALFLDDDDVVLPEHIQRLVAALERAPQAVAAYAGVRVIDALGQTVREYDLPWAPQRLHGINFLPIHAVLFRRDAVRRAQARFDPTLPVLEDWHFWCQLAALGPFEHVPGVSALYRQGQGHSQLANPAHPHHWSVWHRRILERAADRWSAAQIADVVAWHAITLDARETDLARAHVQLSAAEQDRHATEACLRDTEARLRDTEACLRDTEARLRDTEARLRHTESELALVLGSRTWRWTQPLRSLARRLRGG
jgi:LmbE family N-acetylglucosaminyl deacetylase